MEIKDKIVNALFQTLKPEYVRLEDDDGISGFVVSHQFEGLSALDRQEKIKGTLQNVPLSQEDRRRVFMIAALTPVEYEAVGARIRVHRVRDVAGGKIEVVVHGGHSDAEYVRGALNNQKGVQTDEPKRVSGALGVLMAFRAKGTPANPLTKEKAIQVLRKDRYIEIMPNA